MLRESSETNGLALVRAGLACLLDVGRVHRPQPRGSLILPLVTTGLGVSVGAGLMFFLDPRRGSERRARLRDRLILLAGSGQRSVGETHVHG
jgi:hypothetical protein